MGWTQSRRPGQRLSSSLAGATDAARWSRTFRPRLESLEQWVQLGDTILGLSAVALWGLDFPSVDVPFVVDAAGHGREWHHGLFSRLDAAASLTLVDSRNHGAGSGSIGDYTGTALTAETAQGFALPILLEDHALAEHMAAYRLAVPSLDLSQALPADVGPTGGVGTPWLSIGVPLFPLVLPANGAPAGRSLEMFAASGAGLSSLGNVSFDVSTGQLAIRASGGDHTVREAVAADGFVDVTFNGRDHSSNPVSTSFDSALAGATAATLASIRFDGDGQDRLILGSQHVESSFTVQATGATVVTEDVVAAGPLAIQAPNITINGAVRGSTVSLAASEWVSVNAGGRIDALHEDSGGHLMVAAGVFVNSGQLHADGRVGGQVIVRAGNILNAGPVTANATDPGGDGGQVRIAFTGAYVATTAAVLSTSSAAGLGGRLIIDGGSSGHLFSSGRHLATGLVGGTVDLFGRDVVLAGATVDASGAAGGGLIRVGGDFHGRNPAVADAQTVTVTSPTRLRAEAENAGAGGRVVVWSERETTFDGSVSVRGASKTGQGGLAEISGKGDLAYAGTTDAGAREGNSGTLVLDPKNLVIADAPAGVFPQFDLIDPHPTAGGEFGGGDSFSGVSALSNGNVVVTNPNDNFGGAKAGAVYLFDGLTGSLISSLVSSNPGDELGNYGVTPLNNGNYVVDSPRWNSNRGAVTWGNGGTGISGIVSESNSLVGSHPGDGNISGADPGDLVGYVVGFRDIIALSNGNYVVPSWYWNGARGAVTWGNGSTGVSGIVSEANSLIGSYPWDLVGHVTPLSNGSYVVTSPNWNAYRGAATWGDGNVGVRGEVSETNSLVGSTGEIDSLGGGDLVGYAGITALSNGNYVVDSAAWNGARGAVTWGNGTTGISGIVSESNSLVGSNPLDGVGGYLVIPLSNGNYVVASPAWNGHRGAATWGNGGTGVSGLVSEINSLVGSKPGDRVGDRGNFLGGMTALNNGNYVVTSPFWNNERGAATCGNGTMGVSGIVSDGNSLVGSEFGDQVGDFGATALSNGNYVVQSRYWNGGRGAATWGSGNTGVRGAVSDGNSFIGSNPGDYVGTVTPLSNGTYVVTSFYGGRGAVSWGDGNTGGTVSEANSLVGSDLGDLVGSGGVTPLSNGNYVVASPFWNSNRGAVTWGNGTTGVSGIVSAGISLVGSNPQNPDLPYSGDLVGNSGVISLNNGNYVVDSPRWNSNRGAVTWGNGTTGINGIVSESNSLVGSHPGDGNISGANPGDLVGYAYITALSNGNYVVPSWNGSRGAVTWGNGSSGVSGTVSATNSLVGSNPGDFFGAVTLLSNGNYLVASQYWNGSRGAVTWASGTTGQTLDASSVITPQNSLVGRVANAGLGYYVALNPTQQSFLARFATEGSGRVTVGLADPNQFTYARGQSQTVTLTPDFLARTLRTGTAVILQASNDITVNSPITVSAGGHGGALTLQAGRSINLNASITTDGGALTLIANDQLANGVVDSQRDAGNAVITMAPGTILDTGSAALTVQLRDGAGLTNRDSGSITLQTIAAGSVSVVNNGPSAGSDVKLGQVTTSGPQSYANPNGTATVTGNLTAADNPITFNHSVVLNAGLTLSVGSSTVNFAGGTVSPSPGAITIAGGVIFTGLTTLSATLNGTDPGSYAQLLASGPIALGFSTLSLALGFEPPVESGFEILTNTGSGPITTPFNGLSEGAILILITQGGLEFFQITYQGDTGGNSVVLTRLA